MIPSFLGFARALGAAGSDRGSVPRPGDRSHVPSTGAQPFAPQLRDHLCVLPALERRGLERRLVSVHLGQHHRDSGLATPEEGTKTRGKQEVTETYE